DETVATVDETGKVTALKPGSTHITVTTANGITKSCEINVIVILAYDIALNIKEAEMNQGESRLLTATVSPKNTTDKTVIWTSADETIATVDETGKVTALKPGITDITASTTTRRTASCTITVKAVDADAIILNRENVEITEGDYVKLTSTVSPENTTDKSVTWTSADETIATVDALGKVKARKPGTTHITATTANGISALCDVTVLTPIIYADSISLNIHEEELIQGESAQLTATVSPENATDKSVTWTSADETVATVDDTGKVKAIDRGETEIVAITANGLTASYKITVKVIDADSITLNLNDTIMAEGDYVQLTATISPENTTNKTVTWNSTDETVATVDANGRVTAFKSGITYITATTANGLTTSCEITVVKYFIHAESISLNLSEEELTEGDNVQLIATISPENATYKSVKWASVDKSIATVDKTGLVTAVKPGETEITATTANGITATCRINVRIVEADSITLNLEEAEMTEGDYVQLYATVSPKNTTDKTVIWTSADETVAAVDETGLVTAISPGKTIITATTSNDITVSCLVTVFKRIILAESISINLPETELTEGESVHLTAIVSPDDTDDKTVTWTSYNPAVATVNESGLITAIAPGKATIIATTVNGLTASCIVTVLKRIIHAESISINLPEAELSEGESVHLTATVSPDDTVERTVTWTSGDGIIATVDETGTVTAISTGETDITATTANGVSASCRISVKSSTTGIHEANRKKNLPFIIEDGTIIVDENTSVEIFNLNGTRVYKSTGKPISGLHHGIYILRANGKAYKISL
ncbi:MAG: Ig-like domain-containing protein, partial [Paramuribaculum sp.]|nr:Ig-like domain-containing protein [Paramuribaculum sp.]